MGARLQIGDQTLTGLLRHGVIPTGEHIHGGVAGFRPGEEETQICMTLSVPILPPELNSAISLILDKRHF